MYSLEYNLVTMTMCDDPESLDHWYKYIFSYVYGHF